MSELKNSVENELGGSSSSKSSKGRTAKKVPVSEPVEGLDSISEYIPYSRTFIKLHTSSKKKREDKGTGLMKNIKGIIGGMKSRKMDIKDVLEMRASIGNLKKTKIAPSAPSTLGATLSSEVPSREQKTKKQLLEEKRQSLKAQSKLAKPDNTAIGLRIEIEKMKKKFPNDYNLIILSSIVTCRDGCLKHRTIEERVTSLYSALQEAGEVVLNNYLTTFSVDTVFDIYFLYLTALKKQFVDKFKKISSTDHSVNQIIVESTRRDIRIINALLEQRHLKKTIFSVTKKLNGFKYPFESMTPFAVAKSFNKDASDENAKTGPGTVKLNKFLIKIYLNIFAQIPFLQPLAKKLSEGLPDDQPSRVLIANVTLDNAFTQLKIFKACKDPKISKHLLSMYNFGKQFIESNLNNSASNIAEGKILLRTAEMAEEYAFMTSDVSPEIVKYGYLCASIALPFYKGEAEGVVRRIYEFAEDKKIDLDE